MPFVNVKILQNQFDESKKEILISELTDLIVTIIGREKELIVIVIVEIKDSSWATGGKAINALKSVSFITIKVSKGTTNSEEMAIMQKQTKELRARLLDNYIEELFYY